MTWIFLTAITVTGLTFSLTWALVRITSKPTPKPEFCTRQTPHVCRVNGSCNGLPMTPEPEDEYERRKRG
jgi:hypothetical protein